MTDAAARTGVTAPAWAPRRRSPRPPGGYLATAARHDEVRAEAAHEAAARARDPLDLFVLSAMPPYGAHTRHLHDALARDATRYWHVAPDHPAAAPGVPASGALDLCIRQLAAELRDAPAQPAVAALSRSCHVALAAAVAVLEEADADADAGAAPVCAAERRLACHLHLIAPDAAHPDFLPLWRRAIAHARAGRLFLTVHASVHDPRARPLLEATEARHENASLLLYTAELDGVAVGREPDHFHTQVCALARLRGRAHAALALEARAVGDECRDAHERDRDGGAERRVVMCEVVAEEA